jgi:hypothetical protein
MRSRAQADDSGKKRATSSIGLMEGRGRRFTTPVLCFFSVN